MFIKGEKNIKSVVNYSVASCSFPAVLCPLTCHLAGEIEVFVWKSDALNLRASGAHRLLLLCNNLIKVYHSREKRIWIVMFFLQALFRMREVEFILGIDWDVDMSCI